MAEKRSRRDYVWFGIFAGAAVATKDQAFAGFVLPALLYVVLLPLRRDRPFGPLSAHYKNSALAAATGAVSLGLLGGGFFNPTGFVARFRELTGGASHDWMTYARTPLGVLTNVIDIGRHQGEFFWPWIVVALCWLGVARVATVRGGEGIQSRVFRLLPLCSGVSSIVFFTLIVARCEHRFVLPLGFWLSYYGGVASACLLATGASHTQGLFRAAQASLGLMVLWAAGHSFEVHLTQLADARHRVSAYLDTLPGGTVVETYGLLAELPHFNVTDRARYRVQRVSRRPIPERNPLMGAREVDEPYGNVSQRRPDVLVVPEHTAKAHVPGPLRPGMARQTIRRRQQLDGDARSFFSSVLHDTLDGYEVVFVAKPVLPRWAQALGAKPVRVHESVGYWQWVLRRKDL